jgi:predicted PurR-regulated permease PerM
MPRLVSFFALLAIVVLVGLLFFQVIATFVLPLFLALILVVIFRPMYRWFVVKCKGRDRIAAAITTLVVALIVLVPTVGVLVFAGFETATVVARLNDEQIAQTLDRIREQWRLGIPKSLDTVEDLAGQLETNPLTDQQLARLQEAAERLNEEIGRLVTQEWGLPLPERGAQPPANLPERDEEILALAAQFRQQLHDFEQLQGFDPAAAAIVSSLSNVRETYFLRLRPMLVDRTLPPTHTRLRVWLTLQANPSRAQLTALRQQAREWLTSDAVGPLALTTGRKLGSILIGLIIMTVALYFFFADGPAMADTAIRLAPLEKTYVEQLLTEFDKVSRAVVVATLLAAVAQGLLGGIGYWLAGFDAVFLLTILTAVLAMIPFVGATAVWLPCCLWLLIVEQRPWAAGLLALYGVSVVSTVDNIIKPLVLHGQSNIHPLLALLSVLGGVKALGPIGVFVGPMAVAFLQAVLNMLQTEIKQFGQEGKQAKGAGNSG